MRRTEARIALFNVWKIFRPWTSARDEPMNSAPMEHMDSNRRAFSDEGRNE